MNDINSRISLAIKKLKLEFGAAPVEDLLNMLAAQLEIEKNWPDAKIKDQERAAFNAACSRRNLLAAKVRTDVSKRFYDLMYLDKS